MTAEEAIKIIEGVQFQFQSSLDEVDVDKDCTEAKEDNQKVVEALGMATKALEKQKEDEKNKAWREHWAERGY